MHKIKKIFFNLIGFHRPSIIFYCSNYKPFSQCKYCNKYIFKLDEDTWVKGAVQEYWEAEWRSKCPTSKNN